MSRPSKYKEEYIKEVDVFLSQCKDKETDWLKSYTEGKVTGETYEHRIKVTLPTWERFAAHIGVDNETLVYWAKRNKGFSGALKKIHEEQKHRLLDKGLSGDYNPTIAKLILSANHGMKEKTDITSNDETIKGNAISFKSFKDATRSE